MNTTLKPHCILCNDTGSLTDAGYLDCPACDSAMIMTALGEWLVKHPKAEPADIFLHGRAVERITAEAAVESAAATITAAVPADIAARTERIRQLHGAKADRSKTHLWRDCEMLLAHIALLSGAAPASPSPAPVPESQAGERDPSELNYLLSDMDAMKWADEFVKLNPAMDHGLMLTWFACAIMTGYDEANRRRDREAAPVAAEPEGWTENTGLQPVADGVRVEVEFGNGVRSTGLASGWYWSETTAIAPIVRWRPAAPLTAPKG